MKTRFLMTAITVATLMAASVSHADMDCQNEALGDGTYYVCKAQDGSLVCFKDNNQVTCPAGAW